MESPHAEWGKKYHDLTLELFNAVTRFLEARAALLSDSWSEALDQAVPALKSSPTLSSKVIRVYRSLPGLNSVLVGMRTQRYVRDVMNLEPLLTPEQAFEALECSP
jgi:hypothetical protein